MDFCGRQSWAGLAGTPSADGPQMVRGWLVPVWGRCLAGYVEQAARKRSKNPYLASKVWGIKSIKPIGYILRKSRDAFFLRVLGAAGSATHTHPAGIPQN